MRRAAREPSAVRLVTFSFVAVEAIWENETLAIGFVRDRRAEAGQRDLDAGEEVAGAPDRHALDDRQRADHRPGEPRPARGPEQRIGGRRDELQDLHRALPDEPRVGCVRLHRRHAAGVRAAAAEVVEHALDVAPRLCRDQGQVRVAFDVLGLQEAGEQDADREEQHHPERDRGPHPGPPRPSARAAAARLSRPGGELRPSGRSGARGRLLCGVGWSYWHRRWPRRLLARCTGAERSPRCTRETARARWYLHARGRGGGLLFALFPLAFGALFALFVFAGFGSLLAFLFGGAA